MTTKISEAASLALHTLALMARNADEPLAAKTVAATLGASENHLHKVLGRLVKAGLIRSTRGPKGGFTLAKTGDRITLLEVFEAIEGPMEPITCLLEHSLCDGTSCIFGDLLERQQREFRDYLANVKLSETKLGIMREASE